MVVYLVVVVVKVVVEALVLVLMVIVVILVGDDYLIKLDDCIRRAPPFLHHPACEFDKRSAEAAVSELVGRGVSLFLGILNSGLILLKAPLDGYTGSRWRRLNTKAILSMRDMGSYGFTSGATPLQMWRLWHTLFLWCTVRAGVLAIGMSDL